MNLFALALLLAASTPSPEAQQRRDDFVRRFIYQPSGDDRGDWTLPEGAEDATIEPEEGVSIHGWWVPPPEGRPAVIFFHGNGGNVAYNRDIVDEVRGLDAGILAVDYRGYGRSTGRPTEEGLYADAEAAWRHVTQERGVAAERVFLMAHSLGTGVAVELATRRTVGGVILIAPFTSIPNLVTRAMGQGLARLVPDRFDSVSKIANVHAPVLILHGTNDSTIPMEMGRELFDAASEPKTFVELTHSDHNDFLSADAEAWREAVSAFLR